ncbi:MAG: hypothetical protein N3E50_03265 [Candidatus Goldbacteria bacterium]|nr:hypothetical protein [Candidatus Goldiibacteriota bacterium]
MKIKFYLTMFITYLVLFFILSGGCIKKRNPISPSSPTQTPTPVYSETVSMSRTGGVPISSFAFGNNYFNWVDWNNNGMVALIGSEEPAKALSLNFLNGANNQSDANAPQLFNFEQMDKFIEYSRTIGAEPLMIVPVYGNYINGGPTSAQMAADIVTYINGTKGYGVKYWTIGFEVDIYDQFFGTTNLPVKTAAEYAALYKSYAQAMIAANAATGSGIEIKFVAPELGWRYLSGNDWLTPILDECKDYIDIVSIHAYGFAAHELTEEKVLNSANGFRWLIDDVRNRMIGHARPGTPLAVTQANVCYDWDPKKYTTETRRVGPGTFYAAIWDADRIGVALEKGLWNHSFWDLAETIQSIEGNYGVFGCIWTNPSNYTYTLNPEYYAQQMVNTNFSGNAIIPTGVPSKMSVYASYDSGKARTAILVINKDSVERTITFTIDNLKPRTVTFYPMSINIVKIPDNNSADYSVLEYTKQMADAKLPPTER